MNTEGGRTRTYKHVEAFCLMKYRSDDGTEEEILWNSRDGVTPFIIHSRSGKEMKHVDWFLDRCDPHHKPKPGDRIFVDLTRERAEEFARQKIDTYWDHPEYPASRHWATKQDGIAALVASMMEQPGQPDVIEAPVVLEIVPDVLAASPIQTLPILWPSTAEARALSKDSRRSGKLRAKRKQARKRRQQGQRRG